MKYDSPSSKPKAVIQFVPDPSSPKGCERFLTEALLEAGYAVGTADFFRSDAAPRVIRPNSREGQDLIGEICSFYDRMEEDEAEIRDLPRFLVGIGGGVMFVEYALDKACRVDGIIEIAPRSFIKEYLLTRKFLKRKRMLERFPNVPIYILGGDEDPESRRGDAVIVRAQALSISEHDSVAFKIYPGAGHDILNDDCRKHLLRDILFWLDAHLDEE